MNDKEIAKAVYDAAKKLNESLEAANKAGLEIEIETITIGIMESPKALMVNTIVWKRMPR